MMTNELTLAYVIPGIVTCNRRRGLEASVLINELTPAFSAGAFVRRFTVHSFPRKH